MPTKQDAAHRATARDFATHGIAELARAFNHCHNPKIRYRYSTVVQQRFIELAAELIELVERGELVPRVGVEAQSDPAFQKLMTLVSGPTEYKSAV